MTDFASASAEVIVENMADFAEFVKQVQTEIVELLMAVGTDTARKQLRPSGTSPPR